MKLENRKFERFIKFLIKENFDFIDDDFDDLYRINTWKLVKEKYPREYKKFINLI